MAKEIERKFLVEGDFKKHVLKSHKIAQGYLSSVSERTVSIRIRDQQGKGIGNESGTKRFEWEKEIHEKEAENLLLLGEPAIIEKIRHIVPTNDNLYFEVMNFLGNTKDCSSPKLNFPMKRRNSQNQVGWVRKLRAN